MRKSQFSALGTPVPGQTGHFEGSLFVIALLALIALLGCGGGASGSGGGGTSGGGGNLPPGQFFASKTDLSSGGVSPNSLALADFNGDGKLDIAVSNFHSNTIAVFLNQGGGVFGAPVITTLQIPNTVGAIVAGDFNEDGKLDLIAATIAGANQDEVVLLGKGNGSFTQSAVVSNSSGFLQGRVVDLNGDGHLDLIAAGNGNMSVAMGNGDGTFAPAAFLGNGPPPSTYFGLDLGDFNGDGKVDIVGVNYGYSSGDVVFFMGNGDGTFQSPTSSSTLSTGPGSVAAADFDGDGKLDVLIGFSPGSATIAAGNGDGTFNVSNQVSVYGPGAGGSGVTVRAADLNKDGRPDALITDYSAGVFTVVLNSATGISQNSSRYSFTMSPGLSDIAVGDLNGDGRPDVVVVNNLTNLVSVFLQ